MENASKALIIAGGILLAIAIIGIGMYVYQQAAGAIDNTKLTAQEIEAYNSEFSQYGGKQNGATVRAMLDRLRTHNSLNSDDESKVIVVGTTWGDFKGETLQRSDIDLSQDDWSATRITELKNTIVPGSIYNITFRYSRAGLIKAISINEIKKT